MERTERTEHRLGARRMRMNESKQGLAAAAKLDRLLDEAPADTVSQRETICAFLLADRAAVRAAVWTRAIRIVNESPYRRVLLITRAMEKARDRGMPKKKPPRRPSSEK